MKNLPNLKKTKINPPNPQAQTVSEHLQEMRSRLLWWLLTLLIGTLIGYLLRTQILSILIQPLHQTIFYSSPAGAFNFIFNISLFFGFLVSIPMLMYQIVQFIEPALPQKLPRLFLLVFTSSSLLLILGMSFAYFVSLPSALYFLNTFATDNVKALISTNEYFSFVIHYLLGFGLIFQLPLLMLAINAIKKLSVPDLLSWERVVILFSFIVAAILTPTPDMVNQILMALPLILLYQSGVGVVWFVNRNVDRVSKDS